MNKSLIAFLSVLIILNLSLGNSAYGTLLHIFDDPTITRHDNFGISVSISGNNVLIGAPRDDTNGKDVGQAHMFDATTGSLLHTFDDPTVTGSDNFGWSVSIFGNNVLIGAPGDDTNGVSIGQVYLFDATTGALFHTFDDPTVTKGDNFGTSVAFEGNNVLIGAPRDRTNGKDVGQAHLFDATTGALLHTFDDPTVTTKDSFGKSVALDGNLVLVGALGDDTNGPNVGQAHLFDATTGALLHTFDDPTVTSSDVFGTSVALEGNLALVGAPSDDTNGNAVGQAYLFDATTGALLHTFDDPTITIRDGFGWTISMSENIVLITALRDDTIGKDRGQVHLFDATTGTLLQTFDDPTNFGSSAFGLSISMSGNNVLTGSTCDRTNGFCVGRAHLFEYISIPVGGKTIPIETAPLILAGAQSFSWMIPVLLSGIGIGLFFVRKRNKSTFSTG